MELSSGQSSLLFNRNYVYCPPDLQKLVPRKNFATGPVPAYSGPGCDGWSVRFAVDRAVFKSVVESCQKTIN